MNALRINLVVYLLLIYAVKVCAVNGIAVGTHWNAPNHNLYGGFGDIVKYTILKSKVTEEKVLYKGNSRWPTIDQTGTWVAFLHNSDKVMLARLDGSGTAEELCTIPTGGNAAGFMNWPDGDWIYFNAGGFQHSKSPEFWRVNTVTKKREKVVTMVKNGSTPVTQWSWGMSKNGKRLFIRCGDKDGNFGTSNGSCFFVTMPAVFPSLIELGRTAKAGVRSAPISGCGPAINPSGTLGQRYPGSHSELTFRDFNASQDKETIHINTMLSWGNITGTGNSGNWSRWSVNSDDWVCIMAGNKRGANGSSQLLFNIADKQAIVVKNNGIDKGICNDPGHFFVGQTESPAQMQLQKSSIEFRGVADGPFDAQTVHISNIGSGSLNPIQTSLSYGPGGDGWLDVSILGSGNNQSIENTIYSNAMPIGEYHATVTIICSNATPSSITYEVHLTVIEQPRLTTVEIIPSDTAIAIGESFLFSAVAKDQFNAPLSPQPQFTWSISDNMSITQTGLFSGSETAGGPYTVFVSTAVAGITKTNSAQISVISTLPDSTNNPIVIIKPDGGRAYSIGDTLEIVWEIDFTRVSLGVIIEATIDYTTDRWIKISGNSGIMQNSKYYQGNRGTFFYKIPESFTFLDGHSVSTISNEFQILISGPYEPEIPEGWSNPFPVTENTSLKRPSVEKSEKQFYTLQYDQNGTYAIQLKTDQQVNLAIYDLKGRVLYTRTGISNCKIPLKNTVPKSGIYTIVASDIRGKNIQRIFLVH